MKQLCDLLILLTVITLVGCDKHTVSQQNPRYVLTTKVITEPAESREFSGTVQPRITSPLSFQMNGKMVSRLVDTGDKVYAGELLAELDSSALLFSLQGAQANYDDAQATIKNALITAQRKQILLKSKVISNQDFDEAQDNFKVAQAAATGSNAQLRKSHEQLQYAELRAGYDGVVISVAAERGQTVLAGQTVFQIAKPEERDAVVDVPEDEIKKIAVGDRYQVVLQKKTSFKWTGVVREIKPDADAATRLWRVKISLGQASSAFRFGTAVRVFHGSDNRPNPSLIVPDTAVLRRHQANFVWVVNLSTMSISLRNVQLLPSSRKDTVVVASGLKSGEEIVTAGVNSLIPGEKIRIYRSHNQ